jgi:hypothetical protein
MWQQPPYPFMNLSLRTIFLLIVPTAQYVKTHKKNHPGKIWPQNCPITHFELVWQGNTVSPSSFLLEAMHPIVLGPLCRRSIQRKSMKNM